MPKENESEKKPVGRREFLVSLGSGSVGFFLGGGPEKARKGIEETPRLWSDLVTEKERLCDRLRVDLQPRRNLLKELLRVSGSVHIVPPTGHPLYHRPGPHDRAAMAVAASLFESALPEANAFSERLRVTDGLFLTGSPLSSVLTATFVPSVFPEGSQVPGANVPLVVNKTMIPYHFLVGQSADLLVKSATGNGVERPAFNHGLIVDGGNWHPPQLTERGGWLKTDFLLLSVLPWTDAGGGYAAFVSGGHGAGTGGFQLLMDPDLFPLESLEKLVADLGDTRAYQVVFEVSVDNAGRVSMPTSIRVSSECPPRKIQTASLFAVSEDDLDNAVAAALSASEVI